MGEGFQMSADVAQMRDQLEQAQRQVQRLHMAVAKATYELAVLFNKLNVSDRIHDEEFVERVKVQHIRTVHQIEKDLSAAIRTTRQKL
jgi:multidrug resistance efflux pump